MYHFTVTSCITTFPLSTWLSSRDTRSKPTVWEWRTKYVMGTSVSTFFFILKLTEFTNHCFNKSNFRWSVAKSNLTLCNSMKCSTPGFPVLHYLPGFSQTCVHWVGNAIQPSHPLSPSSPAHNLSQHQGLFRWVRSLHHVAKKSNTSLKIDENCIVPLVHILNFYCSPHNRPIIERQVAGAGIMTLFRKSANRKYGGLVPPKPSYPSYNSVLFYTTSGGNQVKSNSFEPKESNS